MSTRHTRTPLDIECTGQRGMCVHTSEGHGLNAIRRRAAAATASRWADAFVTDVDADGFITLVSAETGETAQVWHHEDLSETLRVGEPVALHALYNVLAVGADWRSVRV